MRNYDNIGERRNEHIRSWEAGNADHYRDSYKPIDEGQGPSEIGAWLQEERIRKNNLNFHADLMQSWLTENIIFNMKG